jgi:CMP-N,N'-diacetyllegionaminic acid synthase
MILGIIPARAGSKGIENKNMASCAGRPLIDWTLQVATESKRLDHVVVSSDSTEILAHCAGWANDPLTPVTAFTRPDDISGDDSRTEATIEHVLKVWDDTRSENVDTIVLLQPTSPMREARHIDEAIFQFKTEDLDSLLSVVPSHSFLWQFGPTGEGVPVAHDPISRPMRQQMKQYEENGAIYVTSAETFGTKRNRLGGRIGLYVMPEEHRLQIDTPLDLKLAGEMLSWRSMAVA